MYKIAVIGDQASVMGFRALGLETYAAETVEQGREILHQLAKTDCAVVYITEQLAVGMQADIARYKDALRPAVILIPGREGSLGVGKENIQRAIERAVGADIL